MLISVSLFAESTQQDNYELTRFFFQDKLTDTGTLQNTESRETRTLSTLFLREPQPRINRILIEADTTRKQAQSWITRYIEQWLPEHTYFEGASQFNEFKMSLVHRFVLE